MAIRSLRRATLVHAISEHARAELLITVRLPASAVRSVALAAGPAFAPAEPPEPPEHLLFVGGTDPHKNLGLIVAMLALPGANVLPPLLLAGPVAGDPTVAAAIGQAGGERVRCVPAPDDEALARLYRRSLATLVPSRNEGFGLPVLEAMACGAPVLAARAGALPEVAGGAALLLDPDRPEAWRDVLLELHRDPQRRVALGRAGLERARAFSWRRTAEELVGMYREASGSRCRSA
jgi:glycosyltransferase involved in cell wall biosynthesis